MIFLILLVSVMKNKLELVRVLFQKTLDLASQTGMHRKKVRCILKLFKML